jgi:hypothetical protein
MIKQIAAIGLSLGLSVANATILQGRDIEGRPVDEFAPSAVFLYDSIAKVTWLRDANYAATQYVRSGGTQGYSNGIMDWPTAKSWAAGLAIGDFSGWRLPTMLDTDTQGECDFSYSGTDCGWNMKRGVIAPTLQPNPSRLFVYSELAHLWYDVLGNIAYCNTYGNCDSSLNPGWGLKNTGGFIGMDGKELWIGIEFGKSNLAWFFQSFSGGQDGFDKDRGLYAMVVRPGDVCDDECEGDDGGKPIPAPAPLALLGLGLLGVGAAKRSRSTGKGAAR